MIPRAAAVGAALVLLPATAAAQSAYQLANAHTSILPGDAGFISVDMAEAGFGLTVLGRMGGGALGWTAYGSAAARKGEWNMFADFDFTPGFEVGGRVSAGLGGGGADVLALSVGFASVQRKLALLSGDSLLTLSEEYQRDVAAALVYNHVFGPGTAVGLGATATREFDSPGATRAVEVCVPGREEGTGRLVEICTDRYIVPLEDRWRGQARLDVTMRLVSLGSRGVEPHLAGVLAGSVDFRSDAQEVVNLGAGAAVGTGRYSGQLIAAVLFELRDAFDANGQAPEFLDRFGVRIVVGVPFPVLFGF